MKTAIITGAGRGIGLATAKKFLEEGWFVIGTYSRTPIQIEHKNLIKVKCNQADPTSSSEGAQQIKKLDKKIDALINNAGILTDAMVTGSDLPKIRQTFDVNVFGLIEFTNKIIPLMSKGGSIVNISSGYGSFSNPIDGDFAVGYKMSKAALNMYTRLLAVETADKEIAVSSLDPGWVDTDMGNCVADSESKPNRKPEQPAEEIYNLANSKVESGLFWKFGKVRQW